MNPGRKPGELRGVHIGQDEENMGKSERLPDSLKDVVIEDDNFSPRVEESYVTASYCWLQPQETDAVQEPQAARKSPDS